MQITGVPKTLVKRPSKAGVWLRVVGCQIGERSFDRSRAERTGRTQDIANNKQFLRQFLWLKRVLMVHFVFCFRVLALAHSPFVFDGVKIRCVWWN